MEAGGAWQWKDEELVDTMGSELRAVSPTGGVGTGWKGSVT